MYIEKNQHMHTYIHVFVTGLSIPGSTLPQDIRTNRHIQIYYLKPPPEWIYREYYM